MGHNPWLLDKNSWQHTVTEHLPAQFIPRKPLSSPIQQANIINLVIGPRQAGKSTLIWQCLVDSSAPFLLINCEEQLCRELCTSPALFLNSISQIADPLICIFTEQALFPILSASMTATPVLKGNKILRTKVL